MNAERTLAEVVAELGDRLGAVSDSPRLDAELLLALAIDVERSYLYAHPDDTLDPLAAKRVDAMLERRLAGEPLAYLSGRREFWSLDLLVTPATLVPRPETELLVEAVLAIVPRRRPATVLDLGTGSGAIALAVAHERPLCLVTGVDISADALAVAAENGRRLQLANVEWLPGDWTEPVHDRQFDVVVSNPPYVAADDPALAALASEPRSALVAGADGLDAIRRLASCCDDVLTADGTLICEHSADQADAVAGLLAAHRWRDIRSGVDHAGHCRLTQALRPPARP